MSTEKGPACPDLSPTQQRILAAARKLLEAPGGAAMRLEDVAREAGVSRQAVYLNFRSRAGLLVALVRFVDREAGLRDRMAPVPASRGAARLERFLEIWADYLPEIAGVVRAILELRERDAAAAAAWEDRMQALHGACRGLVAALDEDGVLAPAWSVDEAAEVLWALLSPSLRERAVTDRGWTDAQYRQRLVRIASRTLLRSPAGRGRKSRGAAAGPRARAAGRRR